MVKLYLEEVNGKAKYVDVDIWSFTKVHIISELILFGLICGATIILGFLFGLGSLVEISRGLM